MIDEQIRKKFPNEAQKNGGKRREFNQDNYFAHLEIELARKKYLQFSVLMELLNEVLGLGRHASLDEFGSRIRDLVIASHREDPEEVVMPTKEELESDDPAI